MQQLDNIVIEHADAAHGDRAHCQFFLAGGPQLADEKNIEWSAQCFGNFVAYRHASARKRENEHIAPTFVSCKLSGELLTGLSTVSEWEVFHGCINCAAAHCRMQAARLR